MIPVKEYKFDLNPTPKKEEKEKAKIEVKKKRPVTGKVAAIIEDSKSKL